MWPMRERRTGNRAVRKDRRQTLDRRITQCKLLRWELSIEPGTRTESSYKAQIKLRQNGVCGMSYFFQTENLMSGATGMDSIASSTSRCVCLLSKSERRHECLLETVLLWAVTPRVVGGGRGDWMELAQDTDRWRALVGTARNFRVP
jgi:hypothetical protein